MSDTLAFNLYDLATCNLRRFEAMLSIAHLALRRLNLMWLEWSHISRL